MTASPEIDAYIAAQAEPARTLLTALRALVREAAPEAVEKIGYGMPAFALNGALVYFAAWKAHVGFYPGSSATVAQFADELAGFTVSKGAVQLAYGRPLPEALIRRIVERRVAENLAKPPRRKR